MLVINESEFADISDADANKVLNEFDAESVIRVGVEAIKLLIERDRASQSK
jgi:hypothetical protein